MRVFVTGASGGIGSAVVSELIAADHQVVGLARSESSAATISQLGAEPLRGDVADLDVLRQAAGDTDGVIYLAFNHDFTQAGDSMGAEARAVGALGEALVGTGKPLVLAGGTPAGGGASEHRRRSLRHRGAHGGTWPYRPGRH
jgi:nucleoside-diphosphate-sugar epimerase